MSGQFYQLFQALHMYVHNGYTGDKYVILFSTETIHGSFRSKRKQQQESATEHSKVIVDTLKETPPLCKRIALRPRRARLRPLVHFDHQSISIVIGTLPANIHQFGMCEHIGLYRPITGILIV